MTTTWSVTLTLRLLILRLLQRGSPLVWDVKPEEVQWEGVSLERPGHFCRFAGKACLGKPQRQAEPRHSFSTFIQPYLKSTGRSVSYPANVFAFLPSPI